MKKMQWHTFSRRFNTELGTDVKMFFMVQISEHEYDGRNESGSRKRLFPTHTHDFAEIFWVEAGKCYHRINNKSRQLEEGDLTIIRPTDNHGFRYFQGSGVSMTNVVILPETLEFLQMRYLGPDDKLYELSPKEPRVYKLTSTQLKWIKSASRELARSRQSLLSVERFLVDLIYKLSFHENPYGKANMPGWLRRACDLTQEQQHFSKGVKHFVHLSAHCGEHVSREVKRWTGRTTTEIVNDARMEYASQQLIGTQKKIVNIAYDCGYESVSYFYRVFEKHFGISPRTYRIRNRTM